MKLWAKSSRKLLHDHWWMEISYDIAVLLRASLFYCYDGAGASFNGPSMPLACLPTCVQIQAYSDTLTYLKGLVHLAPI